MQEASLSVPNSLLGKLSPRSPARRMASLRGGSSSRRASSGRHTKQVLDDVSDFSWPSESSLLQLPRMKVSQASPGNGKFILTKMQACKFESGVLMALFHLMWAMFDMLQNTHIFCEVIQLTIELACVLCPDKNTNDIRE